MSVVAGLLLAAALGLGEPPSPPPAENGQAASGTEAQQGGKPVEELARPEDKTLVAALDVEQGEGKDRVSLYRDGTLALVRTYGGVRKLRKRVLSEEEVGFVRGVCAEALSQDVVEYLVDVGTRAGQRRFRIEVGRSGDLPRAFVFDELARIPLVLGRARGVLQGLLDRFDEGLASGDGLWDPSGVRVGDVLTNRSDGKTYRVVRDDAFVRSLEMLEEGRGLQRLLVLREDVPSLFFAPGSDGRSEAPR